MSVAAKLVVVRMEASYLGGRMMMRSLPGGPYAGSEKAAVIGNTFSTLAAQDCDLPHIRHPRLGLDVPPLLQQRADELIK
jgi:hypothetical protein